MPPEPNKGVILQADEEISDSDLFHDSDYSDHRETIQPSVADHLHDYHLDCWSTRVHYEH